MILKKFLLLIGIMITTASFSQKNEEVASIARTTCYGLCPYYKIKVFSDACVFWVR